MAIAMVLKKFILCVIFILIFIPYISASLPRLLNVSGRLRDNGVLVSGDYNITFKIYDVATLGTPLWEETHYNVSVDRGYFSVILGETNPLNLDFNEQYWLELVVNGETLSPRIKLTNAGYAFASLDLNPDKNINVANTLYIDISSKRVGINTIAPATKLHIIGSDGSVSTFPTLGAKDFLVIENNGNANINLIASTASDSGLKFTDSGASSWRGIINYNHSTDSLWFGTAGAERLRITSTGNVGIGTSSPGAKLDVTGETRATIFRDRDDITYYIDPASNTSAVVAGDIFGNPSGGSELRRFFISSNYRFSDAPIINFNNDELLFANYRYTIDTNVTCYTGSIANMFDGKIPSQCYIRSSTPEVMYVEIDFGSYPRHYFYAYGVWQSWAYDNFTNNLRIEVYRDTSTSDGWDCNNANGDIVWTTIYDGPASDYVTIARAYYNGICKIRYTFWFTDDTDGDTYYEGSIGELMAYHAYYNEQVVWPAVHKAGDTMYGDLRLYGSTSDLFVDGSVGIGTTTPTAKLGVAGDIHASDYIKSDTGFCIGTDCITSWPSSGTSLWTDAGTYIYPNNYTQFVITDVGQVGIGTTSPKVMLDVEGGIQAEDIVKGKTISTSGFWSTAPSSLSNMIDEDELTATTEGKIDAGDYGDIEINLGSVYKGAVVYLKIGFRNVLSSTCYGVCDASATVWQINDYSDYRRGVYPFYSTSATAVLSSGGYCVTGSEEEIWYLTGGPFWGNRVILRINNTETDPCPLGVKVYELYIRRYE